MRIAPAVAAMPFLIVLLTWLSVRAVDADAERFDLALAQMDNFEKLEAALHRDVLSARAGVLRNYDPLVRETDALDASLDRLREIAAQDTAIRSAIERHTMLVARQEELIEQFKSNNALLRNSLAYFALFSSQRSTPDLDGSLTPAVSALAAAMLRLTLDTSAASAAEVESRLDGLARLIPSTGDATSARALLAHGRVLHDLLPITDGILKALSIVPPQGDQEALRTMIRAQQIASRARAREFRLLLYVTSLLLVGLLAYVGLRLHVRARALRRRAAFERVIAVISMAFITARAQDLDSVIEQALADMAQCVGADRAYFLLSGPSPRTHAWCRQGLAFSPSWPNRALLLVDRYRPTIDEIVHVPHVMRMRPGADRVALAAAGLQGWACVSRRGVDGNSVLLGFDAVTHPCRITRAGELGLLRMALDAIVNALSRQSLEQERTRLEMRLQQARRLETVGTFASGIAHNFNNIVGAILGYTEMADEQDASSGILNEIRRAGERARELVDQILTFARSRDSQRHPVSVQALTAEATSLLRASLPATAELVIRETSEEAIVSGVNAQLQQVVLNLCNNAAQAMGYVGRIEVEIDVRVVTTVRSLSHGVLSPGSYVRVAVSDTGCGIDEASLERIFEPFFTTRVTGNGLGLATTRDIVREHGGTLNVQSTVGSGSRFEVWLPRTATVTSTSSEDFATLPLGHGETVLVVEDDPERLLRDEEIVAALGYEPVGFTRAVDARAMCQETPERFDVLVVGRLAPMTAALDLAAALREIAPGLPILLATASADDFGASALMAAGISDIVPWPLITTETAATLQDCLRRRGSQEERGSARNIRRPFHDVEAQSLAEATSHRPRAI
jgi:signal transduction histidine kinase/FixJ family two-component response regulator